jgi:hypothetical protein
VDYIGFSDIGDYPLYLAILGAIDRLVFVEMYLVDVEYGHMDTDDVYWDFVRERVALIELLGEYSEVRNV